MKRAIFTSFLSFSWTNVGFGFGIPKFFKKSISSIEQASSSEKKDNRVCAQFSGTWEGTCKSQYNEGGEIETEIDRMEIVQHDCEAMEFDNVFIPIPGTFKQSISFDLKKNDVDILIHSQWNEMRNSIDSSGIGMGKFNDDVYNFNFKYSMKRINDEIRTISNDSIIGVNNDIKIISNSSCTYLKVEE